MMSNKPTWFESSPWGKRSPRQDRRVIVNGKFIEQTGVILPTPEPEVNTALEVVHETVDVQSSEGVAGEVNKLGSVNPSIYIGRPRQGVHTTPVNSLLSAM